MLRADYLISRVLTEDRVPALHAKWLGKLNTSHDTRLTLSNSQQTRAKAALGYLHDMDPTPNKQYMGKLVDWYHKGQFRVEDSHRVFNAVKDFHQLKTRITAEHAGPEVKNPKDFSSYPSIHHLERALKASGTQVETPWTKTTESQRRAVKEGSNIVHDDADLTVRAVHTHDAMRVLGSNTSWCVVPDKETFDEYREQGPLYHIHEKKTGARKLLHFGSDQFMDENDEEVDHADYGDQYPALKKLFHGKSYDKFNSPEDMDQRIKSGQPVHPDVLTTASHRSRDQEVLHKIATSERAADHWTKLNLLTNPATSAKSIEHLHATTNKDRQYDRSIAAHPNTPAHILDRIVDDHMSGDKSTVLRQVASNRNTRPATLERLHDLAKDHFETTTKAADAAPLGLARAALRDRVHDRHGITLAVASNPNTPQHVLSDLLARSDRMSPHLRRMDSQSLFNAVVNNPNTHAKDLHAALKMGVDNGTATPGFSTSSGSRDKAHDQHALHTYLSRHPNADAELLTHLHSHTAAPRGAVIGRDIGSALIQHPNAPAELLSSHIGNTKAHMHMATNPGLPHDLMHKIVDHEVPPSREAFYEAPHNQLNALYSLAKNPSTPADVLHKIHGKAAELGSRLSRRGTVEQIKDELVKHRNISVDTLKEIHKGELFNDNPAAKRLKAMGVEPENIGLFRRTTA